MQKLTLAAASALATIVVATPAHAQLTAPSGPRVELQVGLEDDRLTIDDASDGQTGLYYGVAAGYDVSLGVVALGIDLEAGKSEVNEDFFFTDGASDVFGSLENDRDLYVGGRLTVPVGPFFDIYAKAGYSNVRSVLDITEDDGTDIITEIIETEDDGLRVGAGGRFYINRGAYIGGEYRYSDYGEGYTKNQFIGTLGFTF